MKKLLVIIFPLILIISIGFYFTDRNFNFNNMLMIFSNWEFKNTISAFVLLRDTADNIGELWRTIRMDNNILDTIKHLIDLYIVLLTGLGQLLVAVAALLIDFVDNIVMIVDWLFGYQFTFS